MRVKKWRFILLLPVLIVLFVVWAVISLIMGAVEGACWYIVDQD